MGYVRTRPTPLDTQITAAAWYLPNADNNSGLQIVRDMASSRLHLQTPAGAPAMTVVGFTAAGLGPAVVSQQGLT
ncbi:MAG TPA: hypothetical protein VIC82_07675 [Candidatus Nanopelagicales bacterium]